MVSHRRKRPKCSNNQIECISFSAPSQIVHRPNSSLATRQILPQNAPCRQRYNAAFQALQKAYKQAMMQKQQKGDAMKIEGENGNGGEEQRIDERKLLELKRNMANCRERQRTEELNEAFKRLRRAIPSMPSDKMSKIHTLKIATEYILFLDQVYHTLDYANVICGFNQSANDQSFIAQEEEENIEENSTLTFGKIPIEIGIDQLRTNFNAWRSEIAAMEMNSIAGIESNNEEKGGMENVDGREMMLGGMKKEFALQ